MMKKYQYHIETIADGALEERLNELGLQGWQLGSTKKAPDKTNYAARTTCILERVIIQEPEKVAE